MEFLFKKKLLSAINNNEFYIEYQPIYNGASNASDSAEVFLRWKSKSGEYFHPEEFIQRSEKYGLIIPLTLHLFEFIQENLKKLACRHEFEAEYQHFKFTFSK